MNKLSFPLGIKCIIKEHIAIPSKLNPFNFEDDYRQFKELFNIKTKPSRSKITKIKLKHSKTNKTKKH